MPIFLKKTSKERHADIHHTFMGDVKGQEVPATISCSIERLFGCIFVKYFFLLKKCIFTTERQWQYIHLFLLHFYRQSIGRRTLKHQKKNYSKTHENHLLDDLQHNQKYSI